MKPTITNHKFLVDTIELKSTIETSFLKLAERLYKIRQERLWESEYDTLEMFLLQLDLTQSTCSKLCSIYEHWVLKAGLKVEELGQVSWTSLYSSIGRLEKEKSEDVLHDVKNLTRQDIIEKGRELKNPDCKHEWVQIKFCKKCGKKEKIYED